MCAQKAGCCIVIGRYGYQSSFGANKFFFFVLVFVTTVCSRRHCHLFIDILHQEFSIPSVRQDLLHASQIHPSYVSASCVHGNMNHVYMIILNMHHAYMQCGFMHHRYLHHTNWWQIRIEWSKAWVTRPDRPKGTKDEVKQAQSRPVRPPEGP